MNAFADSDINADQIMRFFDGKDTKILACKLRMVVSTGPGFNVICFFI